MTSPSLRIFTPLVASLCLVIALLPVSSCGPPPEPQAEQGAELSEPIAQEAAGSQCSGTAPVEVPLVLQPTPFPLTQQVLCVQPAECAVGNARLKRLFGRGSCRGSNATLCSNNDDCLTGSCVGVVKGGVASITLTSVQNAGTGFCSGTEVSCVTDGEVAANSQLKCGCKCKP